jgi:hypothetical protein
LRKRNDYRFESRKVVELEITQISSVEIVAHHVHVIAGPKGRLKIAVGGRILRYKPIVLLAREPSV